MTTSSTQAAPTKDPQIARNIQQQIGGQAFIMMGAKNFIDYGNGLGWKIARNAKKVTHIKVTLDAATDTYDVRFYRCWGEKITEKGTFSGIYVDRLHKLIEENTHLYLKLF